MRTLTLHTADELVERWRARAERRRTVWGDPDGAHQIECCATELAAILAASMEMEAAHHGDPEPRTGAYGTPIPPGDCGAYWADAGGEWMCHRPQGHDGEHSHRDLLFDGLLRLFRPAETETVSDDPNALREWLAGERP